jgi:hypothetical protein
MAVCPFITVVCRFCADFMKKQGHPTSSFDADDVLTYSRTHLPLTLAPGHAGVAKLFRSCDAASMS